MVTVKPLPQPMSHIFTVGTHAYNCIHILYATDHVVGPRNQCIGRHLHTHVYKSKLVNTTHVISCDSKCSHLDYKLEMGSIKLRMVVNCRPYLVCFQYNGHAPLLMYFFHSIYTHIYAINAMPFFSLYGNCTQDLSNTVEGYNIRATTYINLCGGK